MADMIGLIFQVGLYGLGLAFFGFFIYSVFMNPEADEKYKRDLHDQSFRRMDRREKERPDRRRSEKGPPEGLEDRRTGDTRRKQDLR